MEEARIAEEMCQAAEEEERVVEEAWKVATEPGSWEEQIWEEGVGLAAGEG